MARRLLRPFLVFFLIAHHGAVSLLGTGLHSLPGCEHRAAVPRSDDPDRGEGIHSADSETPSVHHCPICDYLSQGQLIADPPSGPTCLSDAPHPLFNRPIDPLRHACLPSHPRAPPESRPI